MSTISTVFEIPVIVDAVIRHPEFSLVRCNYLSIECDFPKGGWALTIGSVNIPILMVGLVAVVTNSFNGNQFNSVDSIQDMYERVQGQGDLLINIDDLWLPLFLFVNAGFTPRNGHVYRISEDLFNLALSFREGRSSRELFVTRCERLTGQLSFSDRETSSFSQWHQLQLRSAREQYPKDSNIRLRWQDEHDSSGQLR